MPKNPRHRSLKRGVNGLETDICREAQHPHANDCSNNREQSADTILIIPIGTIGGTIGGYQMYSVTRRSSMRCAEASNCTSGRAWSCAACYPAGNRWQRLFFVEDEHEAYREFLGRDA